MKKDIKIVEMDSTSVYGMTVKGELGEAHVTCDKLGQVCDIYPRVKWNRQILSDFRGQPLCLCASDLHEVLWLALNPVKDDKKAV